MSLVRFRPEAPEPTSSESKQFDSDGRKDAGVAHPVERHLAKVEVASSSLVTRSKQIRNALRSLFYMVPWPSGKAKVCKTFIRQFKSGRYLQTKRTSTRMSFLFGEIEPTGFERSNADVRWTSARTRLDGFDTMIFFPLGRKCNKSGRYPDALDAASKVLRRHNNRQAATEDCRFLLITSLLSALNEIGNR